MPADCIISQNDDSCISGDCAVTILAIIFWISLFLVAYTYTVYPALVWLLVSTTRRRQLFPQQTDPTVTVVVSLYNEEDVLRTKLQNIKAFDYPQEKLTFLFGSDASTDGTGAILAEATVPGLRSIQFEQRRGKASVLNDLVREATGDIIVFSDANTMFRPDTVRKLVRHFADPTVGAVSGELRIDEHPDAVTAIGETSYWNYENLLKQMESDVDTIMGATGGVYAIRRALFTALPTTKAITDDLLIPLNILKQGYRTEYEREALAFERGEGSIGSEFRRKARIGAQNFKTVGEIRNLLHPRHGFRAFALWSHKMIRWSVPFLLVIIGVLACCLALVSQFFTYVLWLLGAFVGIAVLGYLLERLKVRAGILTFPYYFLAMNAALLMGFFRCAFGRQAPTWGVARKH
jgi:poly-beta-1,6-N-acetyl-D-glucosamine synthase